MGLLCAVLASPSVGVFFILFGNTFNAFVGLAQTRIIRVEYPECFHQDGTRVSLCEEIAKRKGILAVVNYWEVIDSFVVYGSVITVVQVIFYHFDPA